MNKKQSKTPKNTEWDFGAVVVMLNAGLLPFVARVDKEPLVKTTAAPPGEFVLEATTPYAQRHAFCRWMGITSRQWEDPTWRNAIVLRYRYGNSTPLELLDTRWRRQLDAAARKRKMSDVPFLDCKALKVPLGSEPAASLVAYIYFLTRSEESIGRNHPLRRPFRGPDFWRLLADHIPHLFENQGSQAILNVREDDYQRLVGQLIYYLQGLESWTEGPTSTRFPELTATNPIPRGISPEQFLPDPDFEEIARIYSETLSLTTDVTLNIFLARIRFAVRKLAAEGKGTFNTIHIATALLEQLQPNLYREYLRWVNEFHGLYLKPLIENPRIDGPAWSLMQSRLRTFLAILLSNPLVHCVLFTEVHRRCTVLVQPPKEGRPAMRVEGLTYAFAEREFRQALKGCRLPKVTQVLAKWKPQSNHVAMSIQDAPDVNRVHCLLAPLMASLFGEPVFPNRFRELANKYRSVLAVHEAHFGPGRSAKVG